MKTTISSIAAELGVTRRSVQDWVKRAKNEAGKEIGEIVSGARVFTDEEKALILKYHAPSKTVVEPVEVAVEVGNHSITIAPPELPTVINLEQYRDPSVTAVTIDDPVSFAKSVLAHCDQVKAVMDADLQRREQQLAETTAVKRLLEKKLLDAKLDSRLYAERARYVDQSATQATQELQELAKDLTGQQ